MPKYRNKFEEEIAGVLGDSCSYEDAKVPYIVKKNYIPDFISKEVPKIYFEAKGYFRVGDTQKYKAIRDSLKKDEELVFILYNPEKKLRKGAKMTMAQWCDKEGLRWFTKEDCKNALDI